MLSELMTLEKYLCLGRLRYDLLRFEIHGVIKVGMESSQKRMKLGMSIKSLRRFLDITNLLRQKHVGGCAGMISTLTLTNSTFARFSLLIGNSFPFQMSGKATQQEDLILLFLKNIKRSSLIRMINGLTILNIDLQSQKRLKFT